ncbi:MAG: hypothetical protein HY716_03885 [Planctomycetes bacterium]|nr:hypothetical protein [Planctomycetota bacterium]
MGIFSFVRNFTIGKPDPGEIALQWYWFEFLFWQNNFYTAGEFNLPMTDEDFEMTDRVNHTIKKKSPDIAHLFPSRDRFLRNKHIPARGDGALFHVFYTANPDHEIQLDIALTIHMGHHLKANMNFIDRVAQQAGMRVTSEAMLLSQFKASDHFVLFANPFTYYRLQTEAHSHDLLSYKMLGKREQIREGLFEYMCTRDLQAATHRVSAGEAAFLMPRGMYYTLEACVSS